jgi:hypothetical protein
MLNINLRYPVYAPNDSVNTDWPIGPITNDLNAALASPEPIAILPVMFNEPHMWCYNPALANLDCSQFSLVILSDIEFESVSNIQDWAKRNKITNYVLATGGQQARDVFDTTSMVYRPWWGYNLLKHNQYQDTDIANKPFIFDALLGARRPHRDYVMLALQHTNLIDKSIANYRDVFTTGIVVNHQTKEFADIFSNEQLLYPYVSPNLNPAWEVQNKIEKNISPYVPWKIYQQTQYSIIAETLATGSCFFLSEKTTKALYARRLFIIFSNANYLKGLHRLGFETFGSIIDESYDSNGLDFDRFRCITEQLVYLSTQNYQQVYKKIKPILDHNHNRLFQLRAETCARMLEILQDRVCTDIIN